MSGDSHSDKNIEKTGKSDRAEGRLDTHDANEAREADKNTISEIGKKNPDNWMSAEGHFAIIDEEQVLASRDVIEKSDKPVGGYEQENRADGGITLKGSVAAGLDAHLVDKSIEFREKGTESEPINQDRLLAVDNATTHLKDEIARLYGQESLDNLNIGKSDVGYALGAYLMSPRISEAVGPEATRRFGQQLMVLGLAPSFGLANEINQRFTEELDKTAHDGSSNFLWGTAFGAILESHPYVAGTIGTIFMGALINEQLFSPEARERNQQVVDLAHQTGNSNPEDLIKQCDKSGKLLGPEAYKAAFEFATGGIAIPHGHMASKGIKGEIGKFDLGKVVKSTVNKLKRLPDEAVMAIKKITGEDLKLLPADGPSFHQHNVPETLPKDDNALFMTARDDIHGAGSSRWKSHFDDNFSKNVPHRIHEGTGRLQQTGSGEVREPYKWPVLNEHFVPDIVRQSEKDSCVAKVGEILSGGKVSEQKLIKSIGTDTDLELLPSKLGKEWSSSLEGTTSLAKIGENGPWAAEFHETPWTKFPGSWHTVIVEGRGTGPNTIAILDQYEATRYEMTIKDFMKAWTRRCVYRKTK